MVIDGVCRLYFLTTVFSFFRQVTRDTHLYLKDIEEREEGGTPAIVESIRAGMVFQLKEVYFLYTHGLYGSTAERDHH